MDANWETTSEAVALELARSRWGETARISGSHVYYAWPVVGGTSLIQGWGEQTAVTASQARPARDFVIVVRRFDGQEQITGTVLTWASPDGTQSALRVIAEVRVA